MNIKTIVLSLTLFISSATLWGQNKSIKPAQKKETKKVTDQESTSKNAS